ncbi:MAG: DUF1501 domain-containing protein, partial [Bacteroidota bacterium]
IAIPNTGGRKYLEMDRLKQLALHPDMQGFIELYDNARLGIIQNVGYANMNGSHFKGRDIWFGGGGATDRVTSGWMGRYLKLAYEEGGNTFPDDFPNEIMPDPLGLEFGNEVSLGFHTEDTIPAAISIDSPEGFFNLIEGLEGYNEEEDIDKIGIPPTALQNSLYKQEMDWILGLERDTTQYAERLAQVYNQATQQEFVTYPTEYPLTAPNNVLRNPISGALRIIARLVEGGCQTKIYLVRIGGFDTHVEQVESYDNTLGIHAALLYHVSAAMKAFQDDLKARGVEDRVLTCTLSEFGRRAASNGSYGSDHGTVAPMFLMGPYKAGVFGENAKLDALQRGNLPDGQEDLIDYRDVFSDILVNWFGLETASIPQVFTDYDYNPNSILTSIEDVQATRFNLRACYPNPVRNETTFSFYMDKPAHVKLGLYDLRGNLVKVLMNQVKGFGEYQVKADLSDLKSGTYIYSIEAGYLKDSKKLVKV